MNVGLHILKHMAALSDERICARGLYDPDFQYFCGAEYFPHERPIGRSSMTNWRERSGSAMECMGKDKAHEPYVFGCRVSVAVTHKRAPAGQFVTHIPALHGNPDDGHTLKDVIEEMRAWTGVSVARIFVDKGYRGHTPQQAQGLSIGPDAWHHTHHQEGALQTIRRRPPADAVDAKNTVDIKEWEVSFGGRSRDPYAEAASRKVDLIPVPTRRSRPYGIIIAPNGTPWVALFGTNKLASIDPRTPYHRAGHGCRMAGAILPALPSWDRNVQENLADSRRSKFVHRW